MTKLIVNADDFGLTPGVNRAVSELHRARALTSATLMANGLAFEDAVEQAGGLAVGCHVVLVDGLAVGEPGRIGTLCRSDGRLRDSLPRFILDLQMGRIRENEIELEAISQIRRLQAAGIVVSHVDTHKHTHLFPRVARPLMRAAAACGVQAIRNPFEPAWSARLTRGALLRKMEVALLRNFHQTFRKLCKQFALHTTEGCIGVSATGQFDAATLRTLLHSAPEGCFELVCHPGYNDGALDRVSTRLRQSREIERQALLEQVPAAQRAGRIALVSFADLAAHSSNI